MCTVMLMTGDIVMNNMWPPCPCERDIQVTTSCGGAGVLLVAHPPQSGGRATEAASARNMWAGI